MNRRFTTTVLTNASLSCLTSIDLRSDNSCGSVDQSLGPLVYEITYVLFGVHVTLRCSQVTQSSSKSWHHMPPLGRQRACTVRCARVLLKGTRLINHSFKHQFTVTHQHLTCTSIRMIFVLDCMHGSKVNWDMVLNIPQSWFAPAARPK